MKSIRTLSVVFLLFLSGFTLNHPPEEAIYPEEKAYVQMDKPLYKPGDDIWFKAWVTDRQTGKLTNRSEILYAEIIDPKGKVKKKLHLIANNGTAHGDYHLSSEAAGGLYKLRVYTRWMKNKASDNYYEREFTVQKVMKPRLLMDLEFLEKGYGPGEEVQADFSLETPDNKPLSRDFTCTVLKNGKKLESFEAATDDQGETVIRYELSEDLKTPNMVLNVKFPYKGQTESISRTIPITLKQVALEFFPEGGDWLAGVEQRIAFKATDRHGKPVDVQGRILNDSDAVVAKFSSYHHGMGAFRLAAKSGSSYRAELTHPNTVSETYPLPETVDRSLALEVKMQQGREVPVRIFSEEARNVTLKAGVSGKNYYTGKERLQRGWNETTIPADNIPAGVMRVTLFNGNTKPECERLIFVNKHRQMQVNISTGKEKYLPREKVEMTIETRDNNGNPVNANLALAVVDNTLLTFADDKQAHILSHLLLKSEVKGNIEEPNFYFREDEPRADSALNYLLMTQGWRRFIRKSSDRQMTRPEKAIVKGRVLKLSDEPLTDHKVWVKETGDTTYTDKQGGFAFDDLKLTRPVTLITRDKDGDTIKRRIKEYADDYILKNIIKGRVLDKENNEPIQGVNVFYPDTSLATVTDGEGRFDIKRLFGHKKLKFAFVGYKLKEVSIQVRNYLRVKLEERDLALAEVAVASEERARNEPVKIEGNDQKNEKVKDKKKPPRPEVNDVLNVVEDDVKTEDELKLTDMEADEEVAAEVVAAEEEKEEERIFYVVEEMPEFPGGTDKLREFIRENIQYPKIARENEIQGKVYVKFKVSEIGEVENLEIVRGVDPVLNRAALEVLSKMPNWKPGMQRGEKVPVWYMIPVNFNLKGAENVKVKDYENVKIEGYENVKIEVANNPKNISSEGETKYYTAREFYAPKYESQKIPESRKDFRETIYWNPDIQTGEDGTDTVTFYNSDAVTTFKAIAEGIGGTGAPGRGTARYYTQLPLGIQAKVPPFVTFDDILKLPVTVNNESDTAMTGDFAVNLPRALERTGSIPDQLTVPADSFRVVYVPLEVKHIPGRAPLSISFMGPSVKDKVDMETEVLAKGFPAQVAFSGQQATARHKVRITDMVEGSLNASLQLYPNMLREIMDGMEGMLQEPHGCFEQASSTTYPNILALRLMKETDMLDPEIKKRARKLLKKGYKKLTSYETEKNGYEWFGRTPPHQSLTAYGLMEFTEMKPLYASVDNEMISRTRDWLLSQRTDKGGFKRGDRSLDNFGYAGQKVHNAYIVYALSESGYTQLDTEFTRAYQEAMESRDAYRLAVMANAAYNLKRTQEGNKLLGTLNKQVQKRGLGDLEAEESIVKAYGKSLQTEITALLLMAHLKSPDQNVSRIKEAVKYLMNARDDYGFGSTQATILSLKALTQYTVKMGSGAKKGSLDLEINGTEAGPVGYKSHSNTECTTSGLGEFFREGNNEAFLDFENPEKTVPYSMQLKWNTYTPQSDTACKVGLKTDLMQKSASVGDVARMDVRLTNKTRDTLPMTIAKIGIPSGLSLQPYQLKELQEQNRISYYEIFDNYWVIYLKAMAPGQRVDVPLDLKAEIPGKYEAPASSAYLYYVKEFKTWQSGENIDISP